MYNTFHLKFSAIGLRAYVAIRDFNPRKTQSPISTPDGFQIYHLDSAVRAVAQIQNPEAALDPIRIRQKRVSVDRVKRWTTTGSPTSNHGSTVVVDRSNFSGSWVGRSG
ncbi:unnamed protein product [Microthlaspi erraticum]|uniref:Uncharacterized protein n=1 Tax=Microthlaspi erraticum TaxID=1685480 RepID=A0A6D2IVW9_9BRAS|nr:unnamed protein product [Microthlaspi erraticum]